VRHGRRARTLAAAAAALAAALAAQVAPAGGAGDAPDGLAAAEAARAEARREWASPAAAAAAWARLERLREPLLASEDARAASWLCDAAEDDLTVGLALDGCGVASAVGLPTPEQRERATALLRDALARTREADRRAREAIAAGAAPTELADRLDQVELARRVPLLRGCAAILAARAGALPSADAPSIVESAAMRLAALRASLAPDARRLADACAGLGFAMSGRRAEAEEALAPLAADAGAASGLRVLAIAGLAEAAAPSAEGRRRALDGLRSRFSAGLDDAGRLVLGDLDFRLAQAAAGDASGDAARQAPAWAGWIDAVRRAPPASRGSVRAEALARIARNAGGTDDPVTRTARALAQARTPDARASGTAALRTAVADPALDAEVRGYAMLELGRAELLLGNPAEGAAALLAFAEANPAEPSSRHAIDAAVAAARGSGDAALLARVLGTAVDRFPDHPDHASWRVEQSAVSLAPDAPAPVREAASQRASKALAALDRADRNGIRDAAMRADLAVAAAEALNDELLGERALAALARIAPAGDRLEDDLPAGLRARILEERIRALAAASRPPESDERVRLAAAADAEAAADAAARVLRRMAAADLGTVAGAGTDAAQAERIARIADAALRIAPPSPDRDEVLARAFVAAGRPADALPCARRALSARGDRADLLLALSEALWASGGEAALAEAFVAYDRVGRSVPEGSPAWWLCQARRLQVLDRVNRSRESIAPRVARLRAMDPALGGDRFAATLLDLAARSE
jgi:hypothetical protein